MPLTQSPPVTILGAHVLVGDLLAALTDAGVVVSSASMGVYDNTDTPRVGWVHVIAASNVDLAASILALSPATRAVTVGGRYFTGTWRGLDVLLIEATR